MLYQFPRRTTGLADIPEATWASFTADVRAYLESFSPALHGRLEISPASVSFADRLYKGDLFRVTRRYSPSYPESLLHSAETYNHPYDLAVRGTLLLLAHYAGQHVKLLSDAPPRHWDEACASVNERTGRVVAIPKVAPVGLRGPKNVYAPLPVPVLRAGRTSIKFGPRAA